MIPGRTRPANEFRQWSGAGTQANLGPAISFVTPAGGPLDLFTALGWGMSKAMPEPDPILEELRAIREELRGIAQGDLPAADLRS